MTTDRIVVAIVAVGLVATSAWGFGSGAFGRSMTPAPASTTTHCAQPSPEFAAAIFRGVGLRGTTIRAMYAVSSPDHQNAYYVAAHADEPGGRLDNTALWATNVSPYSTSPGGGVVSVNAVARRISDWGASTPRLADSFSERDEAAIAAVECVRQRMGTP